MSLLILRNRQRSRPIDLKFLRQITVNLLKDRLQGQAYELGIHLVAADEMARVNETFLQHTGSTDVITFDYSEDNVAQASRPQRAGGKKDAVSGGRDARATLHGEIFISVDDAVNQAKEFKTTWQSELVRYVVHGILHLQGFDDLEPALRRRMKREENGLMKDIAKRFPLSKLQRPSKKSR